MRCDCWVVVRETTKAVSAGEPSMNRRTENHRLASFDCFTCQNRTRAEWCVLNDEDLQILNKAKIVKNYDAGETIYYEGDSCTGIYDLEMGVVAFRKYDLEGNATLISLAYPGRTLGYRSFIGGGNHVTSAEAVKPSMVCFIVNYKYVACISHIT